MGHSNYKMMAGRQMKYGQPSTNQSSNASSLPAHARNDHSFDRGVLNKTLLPDQQAAMSTQNQKFKVQNNSLLQGPISNRSNNSINLKNQRQTVVDNIGDRNKNSLLGIQRHNQAAQNNIIGSTAIAN